MGDGMFESESETASGRREIQNFMNLPPNPTFCCSTLHLLHRDALLFGLCVVNEAEQNNWLIYIYESVFLICPFAFLAYKTGHSIFIYIGPVLERRRYRQTTTVYTRQWNSHPNTFVDSYRWFLGLSFCCMFGTNALPSLAFTATLRPSSIDLLHNLPVVIMHVHSLCNVMSCSYHALPLQTVLWYLITRSQRTDAVTQTNNCVLLMQSRAVSVHLWLLSWRQGLSDLYRNPAWSTHSWTVSARRINPQLRCWCWCWQCILRLPVWRSRIERDTKIRCAVSLAWMLFIYRLPLQVTTCLGKLGSFRSPTTKFPLPLCYFDIW